MNKQEKDQLLKNLMGKLSPEERKKLDNILADKTATEKVLNTPQAKELMKKIMGGK